MCETVQPQAADQFGQVEGVVAEGVGDIGQAQVAEQGQGGVAERGHVAGGVVGAEAAGVFAEGHVAKIEAAVLDAPVVAPDIEPLRGGIHARRDTRDRIAGRGGDATAFADFAIELEDLLQTGPVGAIQVARLSAAHITDRERPRLEATVAFIDRLSCGATLFTKPFAVGGKSPPDLS